MHIAWLGKKSPFCGNVTYGREITNALLDRDYRVSFLHFSQPQGSYEHHEEYAKNHHNWSNCRDIPLPFMYKSQIYTIPTLKSSKVLLRSLRKLKPDLVHASLTLSPLDFLLPDICEELNIPLVATFHPPFDSKIRNLKSSTQYLTYQLYAPFLARYDRVIVFSEIQRDLLIKLHVPGDRVAVIPNGVDEQKYSPGYSNLKYQLQTKKLFVYQGRIATEKNIEALLKAWKLVDLGDDCQLLMVGDGPNRASLQRDYGKEHNIIWLGFVSEEQQRINILRAADVFILPSLVEGLSISLLEAMSCGVACLATDAGADGEVLENGAGVVLNTQGVTAQLKILLPLFHNHPEMTSLLGNKARQRVLERYTLRQNITKLELLYSELANNKQLIVKN
ncbi:glycosyltransferase family 4 protein [Waterburya agarophytonicola K14]|uniref:Glycosyltransferase family 4 protein n=1 Tax=Waterburya agarophytonicola KI4 TaxID=2874699 RepID=A0A964BRL1_9CYAN|nr:glycosyltransferase family 4 protein [Waterburya agarophytonicola]MCC0177278.1 glycosyltransferase family 4 protein [Waterburya agarophytonicola KI4]